MLPDSLELKPSGKWKKVILKKDKRANWPNDDCSDETLAGYLDIPVSAIERIQFIDERGIGDGVIVFLTKEYFTKVE